MFPKQNCTIKNDSCETNHGREVVKSTPGQNKNYRIVFPKGIIEISMSLKCCRAKGIPMMVMVNSRPKTTCINAVYNPPLNSHTILKSRERQPVFFELLTTSLPKGNNTSAASLKHCSPQGIPTTVMHKKMPQKK